MPHNGKVDASYLAATLLRWERARRELDEMEREIRELVLALGKTQTVGNVRASYSAGRRTFDYASAAMRALDDGDPAATEAFARNEKTTFDYKRICEELALQVPFMQSPPSVSVKLVDDGCMAEPAAH